MSVLAEASPETLNSTTESRIGDSQPQLSTPEGPPPPFIWMVKPCATYKEEYKDCKSFKDRFNQYFVDGNMKDCTQRGVDYENCKKWEKEKDLNALNKVIESEKERSRARLKAHFENDVWEHRESPPEDWNKELPESIARGYEGTYLNFKAIEIKEKNIKLEDFNEEKGDGNERSRCSIS